jgi:transglutaminase-like putative cysteine protease
MRSDTVLEASSTVVDTECALLLEEQIRYSYDRPIHRLRHRLVVIPRAAHGNQLRADYGVTVAGSAADVVFASDAFANCVVQVEARSVSDTIEFSIWALVTADPERTTIEPANLLSEPRLLLPTPLTQPLGLLGEIGRELAASGADPVEIGEMACSWASGAIRYELGSTGVRTTAATALAGGSGVCQDYAHIMLALCRAAGVPARYVSGHLIGEGGSHAWVEVLQATPDGSGTSAIGFDPTHDRRTDMSYLTVAVGRDYADVPPTSGTFRGRGRGALQVEKRLGTVPYPRR